MAKRVVLAYSGGLDTSVAVTWLQEKLDLEVVAVAVDVGQGGDFEEIVSARWGLVAVESVVIDARAEMANQYAAPAIAANAATKGSTRSSRPSPAPSSSAIWWPRPPSRRRCRGPRLHRERQRPGPLRGGTRALAPISRSSPRPPVGVSREDCVDYAAAHGIPIEATKEKMYSIDENLWAGHRVWGHQRPLGQAAADVYVLTKPVHTEPRDVVIGFEAGIPVTSTDGRFLSRT